MGCHKSDSSIGTTTPPTSSVDADVILKGVEHMPIQQIASITNSSPSVAFRDIQIMIENLYIDYQAARVVSKKYTPEQSYKTVAKCPSCGANTEVIVGIKKACAYCGQPLVL